MNKLKLLFIALFFMIFIFSINCGKDKNKTIETFSKNTLAGKIIFYASQDRRLFPKYGDLYIINADGTNLVKLTSFDDSYPYYSVWSPDKTKILFTRYSSKYIFDQSKIYIINSDGTGLTNILNTDSITRGATWSPDGSKIAFVSNKDGIDAIYIMSPDGTNITKFADIGSLIDISTPEWSPDGTKIFFSKETLDEDGLFIVNTDGSGITKLLNISVEAHWSPDGTKIMYVKADKNLKDSDIYLIDANGENKINLTNNSDYYYSTSPSWSPDGTKIVYILNDINHPLDLKTELYVINADGTNKNKITNNKYIKNDPDWSPDNKYIIFCAVQDNSLSIYAIKPDGTDQTIITTLSSEEFTDISLCNRPWIQ